MGSRTFPRPARAGTAELVRSSGPHDAVRDGADPLGHLRERTAGRVRAGVGRGPVLAQRARRARRAPDSGLRSAVPSGWSELEGDTLAGSSGRPGRRTDRPGRQGRRGAGNREADYEL
jgi:hypothetical protein